MKKLLFALAIITVTAQTLVAQNYGNQNQMDALRNQVSSDRKDYSTKKYWADVNRTWSYSTYKNFSYVMQDLKFNKSDLKWEKDWGLGIEIGNSYFVPTRPIIGFMKFSIDVDWLDFTYARYKDIKPEIPGASSVIVKSPQQFSVGMGLGLGFHIAPFAKLGAALQPFRVSAYGRFIPSFSGLVARDIETDDVKFSGVFLPVFAYGVSVDYKSIGFGVQMRTSEAKYRNIMIPVGEDNKTRLKSTSTNLYITFHI